MFTIDDISCDVLILGAGGAGMLAALHVTTAPRDRTIIAVREYCQCSGVWDCHVLAFGVQFLYDHQTHR